MNHAAARSRYRQVNIEGASGPQVVVMCFDRLDRDLAGAVAGIEQQDHFATNQALAHAQDLIGELANMLDTSTWEHAGALLAIYDYVLRLLAVANAKKSAGMVREAARHIAEIGAAFRQAATADIASVSVGQDVTARTSFSMRA
jgi:flagellar biosynthetic protein FliS